jgi:hypothetical protein
MELGILMGFQSAVTALPPICTRAPGAQATNSVLPSNNK